MIRAVLDDTDGATAIFTALTLAATFGFVALGLESATGLHQRWQMQETADSAALAGALAIRSRSGSDPASVAHAVARENAMINTLGYNVTVSKFPESSRIEVDISRPRASRFFGLIADTGGEIRVHSAARLEEMAQGCILGLAANATVRINRPSDLALDGCTLISADKGVSRIRLAEADPYRDRAPPSALPCTVKGVQIRSSIKTRGGYGVFNFCQGLTIASGGTLDLQPGAYMISGGPLAVHRGARLSGHGITLLMAAGSSLEFAEGATIELSAPGSGPWAGLAIAGNGTTGTSNMLAGRSQQIVGAVYLPNQSLAFVGSANSPCTQIIAESIAIVGPTSLQHRCAGTGTQPILDQVARLTE